MENGLIKMEMRARVCMRLEIERESGRGKEEAIGYLETLISKREQDNEI